MRLDTPAYEYAAGFDKLGLADASVSARQVTPKRRDSTTVFSTDKKVFSV